MLFSRVCLSRGAVRRRRHREVIGRMLTVVKVSIANFVEEGSKDTLIFQRRLHARQHATQAGAGVTTLQTG